MEKFLIGLLIFIIVVVLGFTCFMGYANEQVLTCTIQDKWIKRPKGDNDELYLVNCGDNTYKVEDLFWKGKFNSADIYGNLEVGKTYEIEVTGYRLGFISEYQNINKYKEVTEE